MAHDRIEINPQVMLGKPVIRGTRIPVEVVIRRLAEGMSHEEILDPYPRLTVEDVQASLHDAAATIAHETLFVPAGV